MRTLVVLAISLVVTSCGPRGKHAAAPTGGTGATTTPSVAATTAPTESSPSATPEPPVVGPAMTPNGLIWPPGFPIPMPTGFSFPQLPTTLPFPFPNTKPPTPTTPNTTPPTTAPPPPNTDGWPADWASLEDQVFAEVNARRGGGAVCGNKSFPPAKPLSFHPLLRVSARGHSQDMAQHGYFEHTAPNGTTPTDRMKAAGYDTSSGYTGENIAAGNATAKATVEQWMESPGHCSNIMDPDFTKMGVGYAFEQGSKYRHYWTQNFAGP